MLDMRVENEIKLYSYGGPFAYEGDDASGRMVSLVSIFGELGFSVSRASVGRHTDYYYTDPDGVFDRNNILLRYRDKGSEASLTIKMPSVTNGLGLSRREIEGDIINDSRFDRWKSVQDFANEFYGPVTVTKVPRLKVDVIRGSCTIRSKVRGYTFTFDKLVYTDPASGKRSRPCYELELESLDEAIGEDDLYVPRLLKVLTETYLFEEETVSKYARGMAFVRSLSR